VETRTTMSVTATARTLAIGCLIGLGFALPISPFITNLLIVLTVLFWVFSGEWATKLEAVKSSRVAIAFLGFSALILIGSLYGLGSGSDKLHYVGKYLTVLLIPVVISLNLSTQEKTRALTAFCMAMALTLTISCLIWLDWLPADAFSGSSPGNPTVFKLHITHSFFMAFAAFFFYVAASENGNRRAVWVLAALGLLAAFNVMFMVKSRTGYAALGILILYLSYLRLGRTGLAVGVVSVTILFVGAYEVSPSFKERADLAVSEASHWQAGSGDRSSIGLRLDYYTNSIAIIKAHPIFGVGTGGFAVAYDEQVKNTGMAASNNPHNQYLLITAQLGLVGLVALLAVFGVYWREPRLFAKPFSHLAMGVLLGFLVGNLFNSFMLDLAERVFFAWATGLLFSGWVPQRIHPISGRG
jgi:O-antigen ligase